MFCFFQPYVLTDLTDFHQLDPSAQSWRDLLEQGEVGVANPIL